MKILSIDTSTKALNIALFANDEYKSIKIEEEKGHCSNIILAIDELLSQCKVDKNEITHYAISQGPGSFTGLRIGFATVKSFAYFENKPIVQIPTLKVMAYNFNDKENIVVPLIVANKYKFYAQNYEFKNGEFVEASEITMVTQAEANNINAKLIYDKDLNENLAQTIAFLAQTEISKGNIVHYQNAIPIYTNNSQVNNG